MNLLDPGVIVEFNETGFCLGEPRAFAKAAPLRKVKVAPAYHSSRANLRVYMDCSPGPARSSRGFSKDHTENIPRGSVSPQPGSWRSQETTFLRKGPLTLRQNSRCVYQTWKTLELPPPWRGCGEIRSSWKADTFWNKIPWVEKRLTLRHVESFLRILDRERIWRILYPLSFYRQRNKGQALPKAIQLLEPSVGSRSSDSQSSAIFLNKLKQTKAIQYWNF